MVCPKVGPIKKKEPWEDITLQQQIKELQKKIKDTRKQLKNDYYQELASNINTVAEAREVEKDFSMAKKYTTFKPGAS